MQTTHFCCGSNKQRKSKQSVPSKTHLDRHYLISGLLFEELPYYLKVREHAQQAPQQTAVYRLPVSLPLNEQQNPVDGFALNLQIADDVEPEQLQTHVPEDHNNPFTIQ